VIKQWTSFHLKYCREIYAYSYFMVMNDGAYFCDRKKNDLEKKKKNGVKQGGATTLKLSQTDATR